MPLVSAQYAIAGVSVHCQTNNIFFNVNETIDPTREMNSQTLYCIVENPTEYYEKYEWIFQSDENTPANKYSVESTDFPWGEQDPYSSSSFNVSIRNNYIDESNNDFTFALTVCVKIISADGENWGGVQASTCSTFEFTYYNSSRDYFSLNQSETQSLTIDTNSILSKERYRTEPLESSFWSTYYSFESDYFYWNYFEFCEDFFESYQMRCQNTDDESFHLTGIQDSEGVRQEINTSSWAELSNGTRLLTLETSFLVNSKLMENGINYCEQCDETVSLTLEIYYIPLDEGLNIPKSVIIVGVMVVVSSIILLGINMKNKKSEEMNENEFTDENMGEILNDTEVIAKDDSVIETIQSQEEPLKRTMVNDEHTVDIDESDLSANRFSKFQLQLLIGVMIGVSIISAFLLFTERGFFEISRFDWLSANCDEFAKNWSMHDTFLYQGDEYYNDVYEQCHEEKFASIINSLILIGSVSTAVISAYFLQKASSENNNSSEIETTSIKDSTTTETHEQSSVDSSANEEYILELATELRNMIKQQELDELDKIEKPEKPIQKPTNTTQISPLRPIEFDTEGYEWSTDRFERPIYRIAGSADHWEILEQ